MPLTEEERCATEDVARLMGVDPKAMVARRERMQAQAEESGRWPGSRKIAGKEAE